MDEAGATPRFLADAMLGRLARWLRVLGFDTLYDPAGEDKELVALADAEQRVLLTRDHHLVRFLRPHHPLLLVAEAPLLQLREVIDACQLHPPAELFSRCLLCNQPLRTATAEEAATLVPESIRMLPGQVRRCPNCRRIYWYGSHTRRMHETLISAIPEWFQ
ncbi:Mut7-C RNAse domain-containing protein [Zobellella maritima]|uniref:Mut7-C RNAse domain-containing protein n=1 Tax=Zobellella maritima TaxID=2059725 RepID=UPI000E30946A|nr:Mut7-C RNAse domain-containing protein [Zobellella maritima]